MRLILVDPNAALCAAWRAGAANLPDVQVVEGRFEDLPGADVLVTAGNSFGLMDGGLDLAVARYLPGIEAAVQKEIRYGYCGELPVGHTVTVQTGNARFPVLAYTPTMRVPQPITAEAVYRAMWGLLMWLDDVPTVACPGLGTGVGQVPPEQAAYAMLLAYQNSLQIPDPMTWDIAREREAAINCRHCARELVAR